MELFNVSVAREMSGGIRHAMLRKMQQNSHFVGVCSEPCGQPVEAYSPDKKIPFNRNIIAKSLGHHRPAQPGVARVS